MHGSTTAAAELAAQTVALQAAGHDTSWNEAEVSRLAARSKELRKARKLAEKAAKVGGSGVAGGGPKRS